MFVLRRYAQNPTPDDQMYGDAANEWPAIYRSEAAAQEVADRLNARGEAGGGWVVEEAA